MKVYKTRHKAAYTDEITKLEASNRQVAYQAALEGIVLLENDGTLPVAVGKVAMYGPGVGMTVKGGTGSGEVMDRHDVTLLEGMENAGFTVTTRKWIDDYAKQYETEEAAFGEKFRALMDQEDGVNLIGNNFSYPYGREITEEDIAMSDTDTCFYVITRQAGEAADRKLDNGDNGITEVERINIEKCAKAYKKFIVVLNSGCSFDMSFVDEIKGINAVLFFCQQGEEGGNAFADIVSGKASPSGKTVDTWAKHYGDIPFAEEYSYLNGDSRNEFYKEGIYVGYRYFDSFQVEPRYCFGYGLSYTDFEIKPLQVTLDGTRLCVRVQVCNRGAQFAGKEVVQLYVSCPQKGLAKEYQKLAAYGKTKELAAGENCQLDLDLDLTQLGSYDAKRAMTVLAQGEYLLRIGNSSRNTTVCGVVELEQEVVVSRHENVCKMQKQVQELSPAQIIYEEVSEEVPRLVAKVSCFETVEYSYDTPEIYHSKEVDELMNRLTVEEMAHLVVGGGMRMMGQGADYVPPYFSAPGSAGITTVDLMEKGIPNVCCADGPAGLRIQRKSTETAEGRVKLIDFQLSIMKFYPEEYKKGIMGDPATETMIYQFTTAFPVGMALAQSWNVDLLEQIGVCVSKEMQKFGVNYWLAPGMNIHRNPLCGRNFEYYSEDPFVTGCCALAITKGVQSIPGNYTTIKHFCCNNQETNRNYTDANMSERALREIYLKGFEICVRGGKPGSVMTSYNKVNGVYANNSYDLCTKVLRNEWGFDGYVMTDWMATGVVGVHEPVGDDVAAIAAGNDLLMPGNDMAIEFILQGLKDNTLSEDAVRRSAANVLKGIVSTDIYREFVEEFTGKTS